MNPHGITSQSIMFAVRIKGSKKEGETANKLRTKRKHAWNVGS
jgi:hypothetical protein